MALNCNGGNLFCGGLLGPNRNFKVKANSFILAQIIIKIYIKKYKIVIIIITDGLNGLNAPTTLDSTPNPMPVTAHPSQTAGILYKYYFKQ